MCFRSRIELQLCRQGRTQKISVYCFRITLTHVIMCVTASQSWTFLQHFLSPLLVTVFKAPPSLGLLDPNSTTPPPNPPFPDPKCPKVQSIYCIRRNGQTLRTVHVSYCHPARTWVVDAACISTMAIWGRCCQHLTAGCYVTVLE